MKPEIKLAYYRKKDWQKLVNSAYDSQEMHDNWKQWFKDFKKTKAQLEDQGFKVHKMEIDIDALNLFCKLRGLQNNGKSRSQYVQELPLNDEKIK